MFRPNVVKIKKSIRETIHTMEMTYGTTGSVFRLYSYLFYFILMCVIQVSINKESVAIASKTFTIYKQLIPVSRANFSYIQ